MEKGKVKYVSGIRPSGQLHLGNYLGVIKHWKRLQEDGDCYFFIANMHGKYSAESVEEVYHTQDMLSRCGILTYWQSLYKSELLEMAHELSFYAKTSRLKNMTQYKDKSKQEDATLALFSYPVLMAADILYHKATHVPVGQDQVQHLELTRELARLTGRVEPAALVNQYGAKIMSLTDPTKKMSKSNPNPKSCIYLNDKPDDVRTKINAAISTQQGVNNLLEIVRCLGGEFEYTGQNSELKSYVANLIIDEFTNKLNMKGYV